MNLDQKQPGFPADVLPNYLDRIGVSTASSSRTPTRWSRRRSPKAKTTCSLCSRLRRGVIYRMAKELGATKIALGHHRDDIVHTLFLNLLFGGKLKAMPPKLVTDDGAHVVIRPLAYRAEADIAQLRARHGVPDHPVQPVRLPGQLAAPEGARDDQEWDRRYPGRTESVFSALQNVVPSHLADAGLFDFRGLTLETQVDEGDTVFDREEMPISGTIPLFVAD